MHDAPAGLSHHLRTLADRLAPGRPDGELLAAWHTQRDEAAFAELVRRHGRLVWGVCRRATTDADDAYQAVFLLLAERAGRLTARASVAQWLFHTARRVGRRAARAAARRLAHERSAARSETMTPLEAADWRPVFDAVVAGLPSRYRDAVVLCELGGLSRAAAAERLGVPVGTLASWLAAARVLLRRRLLRRGVTAGTLTVAGLPPAVTAGVASVSARRLAWEATAMGMFHKLAAGAAVTTVLGVTAGGISGPAAQPPAAPPPPPATKPDPKAEAMRLYREGLDLLISDRPTAIARFTESIRLNPDFPNVYFARAQAHWRLDEPRGRNHTAAVADLDKLLSHRPDDYSARLNRGMMLRLHGQPDRAIADFTRLLEGPTDFTKVQGSDTEAGRNKHRAEFHFQRGWIYQWAKNDHGMAFVDYTAAVRLDPRLAAREDESTGWLCQWCLGRCHRAFKKYTRAAESLVAAGAVDTTVSWLGVDYARLLATCPDEVVRNGKTAVTVAERALTNRTKAAVPPPDEWAILDTLAAAHAEAGDFAAAVRRQTEAVTKLTATRDQPGRPAAEARLALYRSGKQCREDQPTAETDFLYLFRHAIEKEFAPR